MFPPGGVYGTLLEVCDAATLNPTDGSIPLGIVATAPGAFDLEFWPTADSGAPHVEVSVNTPDDQRAAFETAVATAESVDDVPILKFCLTVAGLEPNTAYTGVLTGLADDDRVMRPHTFRFNTTGDPVHPGLQLVPIGENLLFASALHPDDETVDIRAFLVDAGSLPTCDLTTGQIFPLTFADTTVDADRLNALNVEASFRQQHSETFRVSPGATVVVCARWFEDGSDTTSWEREQSIYESSAIAQSPDRMVPTLTIVDWHDGTASPLQRVEIEVATAEGVACGGTWWTPDDPSGATGESAIVCRPGNVATSGIQLDGDRVWDLGFAGDLVVRGHVDVESGFSESSILLPAVDGGCRGVCVIPADRTYRMTMAGVTVDLVESWQPSGGQRAVELELHARRSTTLPSSCGPTCRNSTPTRSGRSAPDRRPPLRLGQLRPRRRPPGRLRDPLHARCPASPTRAARAPGPRSRSAATPTRRRPSRCRGRLPRRLLLRGGRADG